MAFYKMKCFNKLQWSKMLIYYLNYLKSTCVFIKTLFKIDNLCYLLEAKKKKKNGIYTFFFGNFEFIEIQFQFSM